MIKHLCVGASKGAGLPMISEKSGTPSEVSGNEWTEPVNKQTVSNDIIASFLCFLKTV